MQRLILIHDDFTDFISELSVEDYDDNKVRINIEDPEHYTSMDLNVQQVKDLIKVLEAWVKR